MDMYELLNKSFPIDRASADAFQRACRLVEVPARGYLIKQGDRDNNLYFIASGLIRGGRVYRGKEDTLFFMVGGDPYMSMHAVVHDQPSVISLQALEPTTAYAIPYPQFHALLQELPALNDWWQLALMEQLYVFEWRYANMGSLLTATERYKQFIDIRPDGPARIPVKYIAQYLGITTETLSRIRSRLVKS